MKKQEFSGWNSNHPFYILGCSKVMPNFWIIFIPELMNLNNVLIRQNMISENLYISAID